MKKKSRFLTGLLSAVMALSLFALPASAAGADSKIATTPNWEKKGSITINKYDYDNNSDDTRDDGEHGASEPKNEKPMDGVGFTIYKVENVDWLKDYYMGTGTGASKKQPTVADYYSNGNLTKPVDDKDQHTGTTSNGGQLKFENLDLGLYLVVETGKPDYVTKAVSPFLVSVPMTSVDKTNWLYDIIVNPKNSAAYGKATLQKEGVQAGNTVTTMKGYKFQLYKWSNNEWIEIKYPPKNSVDNADESNPYNLTTDENGRIVVDNLTKGVYCFVETAVDANAGYILDADTAYGFSIDDKGAMVTVPVDDRQTTGPDGKTIVYENIVDDNSTLTVKNYKPDFKKEIIKRDDSASKDNDADYGIGDKVPYTLTVNVPENVDKLYTFEVSDEMNSNELVWDANSLVVEATDKDGNKKAFTVENKDYVVTPNNAEGKSGFTIDFKVNKNTANTVDGYKGGTITISYKAELKPGADVNTDGNINKADLKYSNKTNITAEEDDKPYDIHDEAVVYTFKIGILKKNDDGEAMTGVEFTLYKKYDAENDETYAAESGGEPIGVVFKGVQKPFLSNDEAYKLGLNATKDSTDKWFAVEELTTNDGVATAKGLPNGTYKLVETKTNNGYNLLSGPVDATLSISYVTTKYSTTSFDEDGKIIKHGENKKTTFNDSEKYKYNDIIIINRKGFNLPTTGGFGTLLFSGIGALLVVGGVGVLMSTKKKKGNT